MCRLGCGVGVAVRRLEVAAQVGWRRTQVRVPVGCGGAAQVGVAAQVVEQLG